MESNSGFISRISDKLNEQVWYQQLKAKWDELDPQSRQYLRIASGVGAVALVFILMISSIWSVRGLRRELNDKSELISTIQSATEEMRRLRDSNPAAGSGRADSTQPWPQYMDTTAQTAGVDKGSMVVSPEKTGSESDQAKEALFNVNLKHVSIKQVIRFAFYAENGARPVKLRNMTIDTNSDPAGYMDATLALSGFSLKEEKK